MTGMIRKTSPTKPTKACEALVDNNSIADVKNFVYEIQYETYLGEKIPYVLHEVKKRYPVNAIGHLFGYDEKHKTQLFERNKEILKANAYPLKVRGNHKVTTVYCVDSIGLLILTGRADLDKLSPERQEQVIKIVQFMAESTDMRLNGDLVPRSEVEGLFDPSTLLDNPKEIAKDNNLRRALFIKKVREAHPESPNTFNRLHDLAHNDQKLVQGPDVPFKQGWHRKLTKDLSLKDHAQKMASFAAIASGNTDINDINRFERNLFQGLPEKYIPDYIPGQIETTTQTKLIEGETA